MPDKWYEIVLLVQAKTSSAGRRAANAAWEAANQEDECAVVDELAQERLDDYMVGDTGWADWQEESGLEVRVRYKEE